MRSRAGARIANHVQTLCTIRCRHGIMPNFTRGKIDGLYISLYRRDEIRLKVSKLASGLRQNEEPTLGVKRRKTGANLKEPERERERERERKRENLIYFTLYRKTGIHMSVYTQKYGFIHALNSSGGFFLFPWSSSFSYALCFPVLPPPPSPFSTTIPTTPVVFSVHLYPLAREQRPLPPPPRARCLSIFVSLSLSLLRESLSFSLLLLSVQQL